MNKRSLETIGELTLEQSKKYCSLGIFLFVCHIWCVCMAILTWHGFLWGFDLRFLLSFYKIKYRYTYMLQQQQRLRQARFSTTSWWFWLIILGDFFKNEFSLASHGLFIDKIFRGRIFCAKLCESAWTLNNNLADISELKSLCTVKSSSRYSQSWLSCWLNSHFYKCFTADPRKW